MELGLDQIWFFDIGLGGSTLNQMISNKPIMGFGLGSVFGEVGSGAESLGEIASEESLKAAAQHTPDVSSWVAERAAQTAGEEVSKGAMSDWLAQSGTERLGDIGRNLFSKN